MAFEALVNWFMGLASIFNRRKIVRLGFYGAPNAGKTSLANRISMDWLGEPVGKVSEIPHETRAVQKKEHVKIKANGKELEMNLLDMPGIATKVDYREFMKYGVTLTEAHRRSKEATKGIIEAIKWLEKVDAALVVMDSSEDPYTQINLTIIGNLEARSIPVILVANKIDLPDAEPGRIRDAYPQYPVVEVSALKGRNIDELYSEVTKRLR
jgi:GTP-binding protein Era